MKAVGLIVVTRYLRDIGCFKTRKGYAASSVVVEPEPTARRYCQRQRPGFSLGAQGSGFRVSSAGLKNLAFHATALRLRDCGSFDVLAR